jgi:hypothetical protein
LTSKKAKPIKNSLPTFLDRHGLPYEAAKQARKPASEAHNRIETPLFAKSVERHALRDR